MLLFGLYNIALLLIAAAHPTYHTRLRDGIVLNLITMLLVLDYFGTVTLVVLFTMPLISLIDSVELMVFLS